MKVVVTYNGQSKSKISQSPPGLLNFTVAKVASLTINSGKIGTQGPPGPAGPPGPGGSGIWGFITGNISAQTDLIAIIPTNLSQLTNGPGYITAASLPTKVSQLTNDSGFISSVTLGNTQIGFGASGILSGSANLTYASNVVTALTPTNFVNTVWATFIAQNTGAATSGNPQYGGAYESIGASFAGGTSKPSGMRWYNKPQIAQSVQHNNLTFDSNANGGLWTTLMTLSDLTGGPFLTLGSVSLSGAGNSIFGSKASIDASSGRMVATQIALQYVTKTANYTTTSSDRYINCTSGTFNITMSGAVNQNSQETVIVNTGSGTITILPTGSDTINGGSSYVLHPGDRVILLSDSVSNYIITGSHAPGSALITSVFGRTGVIVATSGDYNSSQVTENTNLYFTNARAIAAPLTGYASVAGTITSADTVLTAIEKLNGNAVTPTWDAVLTAGSVTGQKYESVQPAGAGSLSFYYNIVTPSNYNPSSNIDRYRSWLDTNFHDPTIGRIDVIHSWHSYNFQTGGAPFLAGEAAFAFKSEQYYGQDGTKLCEFHLPEFIDNAGQAHRLFSMYTHRPDGYTYVQTQTDSWSFRPKNDNTGTASWLNFSGGDALGQAIIQIHSEFGSGGESGTQANTATLQLFSGSGNRSQIICEPYSGLSITSYGDIYLTGSRTFLNNYILFGGNYFGDNQVYLTAPTNTTSKGFVFTRADGTELFDIWDGVAIARGNLTAVGATAMVGNASIGTGTVATESRLQLAASTTALAHLNFVNGVTPTSPNDGDLWYDGSHLKLRIGGTSFQLDQQGGALSSVFGRTGAVVATSGDYTTAQVTESGNLYYTNARGIGSLLTGYTSGAGTISSSDSVLSAIQKLNGNVGALITGVSSVTNSDGTLTISPSGGAVVGSLNLGHANTWTVGQTFQVNSIGAALSNGLSLTNNTAATSILNQYAPALTFTGQGWKTTATAASQSAALSMLFTPLTGTAAPLLQLAYDYSINASALATWFAFTQNTSTIPTGGVSLQCGTSMGFEVVANNTICLKNGAGQHLNCSTGNVTSLPQAAVTIGTLTSVSSAAMNIASTTKGFLPPVMTTTQKNAISSPAEGLIVYDSTLHKLAVRTASAWETVTSI